MDRRNFLMSSGAGLAATVVRVDAASALTSPSVTTSAPWRTFEVVTEVELWPQDLPARLWPPMPLYQDATYQRTLDITWSGNAASTGMYRDPKYGALAY